MGFLIIFHSKFLKVIKSIIKSAIARKVKNIKVFILMPYFSIRRPPKEELTNFPEMKTEDRILERN